MLADPIEAPLDLGGVSIRRPARWLREHGPREGTLNPADVVICGELPQIV